MREEDVELVQSEARWLMKELQKSTRRVNRLQDERDDLLEIPIEPTPVFTRAEYWVPTYSEVSTPKSRSYLTYLIGSLLWYRPLHPARTTPPWLKRVGNPARSPRTPTRACRRANPHAVSIAPADEWDIHTWDIHSYKVGRAKSGQAKTHKGCRDREIQTFGGTP